MKPVDRNEYVARYERRLQEHGYSPQALGWGEQGRQDVRFAVLAQHALRRPGSSVLDVGCGFADLYGFLRARGWQGRYTGIDLVPGLLDVARMRHPDIELQELDLHDAPARLAPHDFVLASGIFNAVLKGESNHDHIRASLSTMLELATVAACADFLSTYVDFEHDGAWHTDPGWAITTGRTLTRRLTLVGDYMPYEFALFLYRDDSISPRNVFTAAESELRV